MSEKYNKTFLELSNNLQYLINNERNKKRSKDEIIKRKKIQASIDELNKYYS